MSMQRFLIPALMISMVSCEGTDGSDPGEVSRKALSLTQELRIGGLEGDEVYTFGYVATLAPAPDGSVYVADAQIPVIRRYDSSGTHLQDVGRSGQGPGEYQSLDGLSVTDDGRLFVWDSRNQRISVFDGAGEFVESLQVPSGLGGWRSFVHARTGEMFVRIAPEEGFVETADGLQADWARVRADGEVERIVSSPLERNEGPRYVLSGRGGYYRAFNSQTLSALGPDGSLYSMRNTEYRIERIGLAGDTTEITRAEPALAVSAEEHAQWEAWSEYFAQRSPENRSDYFPIPQVKPFARELLVDPEGRLWVSRYTEPVFMEYTAEQRAEREERGVPDYQWRDVLRWDAFDPDGDYIGTVDLPLNTSFMTAVGDVLWGVSSGEFREDYVVRWRIDGM